MKSTNQKTSLSSKISSSKFDFAKKAKWFALASLSIILVGLVLLLALGFNKGIDFTGGSVLTVGVKTSETVTVEQALEEGKTKIYDVLDEKGITITTYQTVENESGHGISVRYQDISGKTEAEMNSINDEIVASLLEDFNYTSEFEIQLIQSTRIGVTANSAFLVSVIVAVLVAIALVVLYLAIRFEVSMGLATLACVLHDIILMCALVVICRIQVNAAFVTAIAGVAVLSINNSIVLFDRVRENLKRESASSLSREELANNSIKQYLPRTLVTFIAMFLIVALISTFGIVSIQGLILPLLICLVVSTYSSIFLIAPFWAFENKGIKIKAKKVETVKPVEKEKPIEVSSVIDEKQTEVSTN